MVMKRNKRTGEIKDFPDTPQGGIGGGKVPGVFYRGGNIGGQRFDTVKPKPIAESEIKQAAETAGATTMSRKIAEREFIKKYGRPLTPPMAKDLNELYNTVNNMQAQIDEMEIKNYKTGPWMKVLPYPLLQYADKDLTNWLAEGDKIFHQNIRKPITGAQAATSELNMLRPLAPEGAMSPDMWRTRAASTVAGTKRAFNTALKTHKKSGYDVAEFNPFPQEETEKQIDVISPDGTEGTIPLGQIKDALGSGYKLK